MTFTPWHCCVHLIFSSIGHILGKLKPQFSVKSAGTRPSRPASHEVIWSLFPILCTLFIFVCHGFLARMTMVNTPTKGRALQRYAPKLYARGREWHNDRSLAVFFVKIFAVLSLLPWGGGAKLQGFFVETIIQLPFTKQTSAGKCVFLFKQKQRPLPCLPERTTSRDRGPARNQLREQDDEPGDGNLIKRKRLSKKAFLPPTFTDIRVEGWY